MEKVYFIQGNYGQKFGYEDATCEETLSEAKDRLQEYRENEPGISHRIRAGYLCQKCGENRVTPKKKICEACQEKPHWITYTF